MEKKRFTFGALRKNYPIGLEQVPIFLFLAQKKVCAAMLKFVLHCLAIRNEKPVKKLGLSRAICFFNINKFNLKLLFLRAVTSCLFGGSWAYVLFAALREEGVSFMGRHLGFK